MRKQLRFMTKQVTLGVVKGINGNYGFDVKDIIMNESPMLLMMFKGMGVNPLEVNELDWMLKVQFANVEQALEVKDKALIIEEQRYYFYLATPSDMKNNRGLFIREDVIPLVKQYESILSCGWLDSIEGQSGVNVNKDVTARLSLFLSNSYHTDITPSYLVLPEAKYKTIQSIKTLENGELVVKEDYEHESVLADGCGIASPVLMQRVAYNLQMNYTPCFVAVRSIKLALKGLLVSVDFIQYFKDTYQGDTDSLKCVNGTYYAKDLWNNWIELNDNTIIINPSMAKWSGKFDLNYYESNRPEELMDIMDALFITKVSKLKPDDIKKTSYQMLCQLAINAEDYRKLTEPTYSLLNGMIKGEKEFIYKFLGNEKNSMDEDSEAQEQTDKLQQLLSVDFERYYKLPWIKRTLANMVERSVKELCSGKFYIEGDFKTIVQSPLAVLNFVATRKIDDPLKENQFWCNSDVNQVLACRFPIANYSEVGVMSFISNKLYSKYCGHWTKELCVFNARDIRAQILSGADFDGDTIFTTHNELLIDAVIPPKDNLHFIMTELSTGKLFDKVYNWKNRTYANVAYMGNLIGEIAILNSCLSNKALDLGAYIDGKNVTYTNTVPNDASEEESVAFWKWFMENPRTMNQSREVVKQIITEQFYEIEKELCETVQTSMIAIDAPKTGIVPDKTTIMNLKKQYKKPYFFTYLPNKKINGYEIDYKISSVMDCYAGFAEGNNENYRGILTRLNYYLTSKNGSWKNGMAFRDLFAKANSFDVELNLVLECEKLLEDSFSLYSKERKERDRTYVVMEKEERLIDGEFVWVETNRPVIESGKKIRVDVHSPEVKKMLTKSLCYKAERVALDINEKFPLEVVCVALYRFMYKDTDGLQRFVFDFYYKYVEVMISLTYEEREVLIPVIDVKGKQILYKKYEMGTSRINKTNIVLMVF